MNYFVVTSYVILDQITKHLAMKNLNGFNSFEVISGFLYLTYTENRGAAFGIFQNMRIFFLILTIIVVIVMVKINRKYNFNMFSRVSFGFIIGGAIGNFIDRLRLTYVVDFIDIKIGNFYDFPVFNFADILIVIGTILLMILLLLNKLEKEAKDGISTDK